MRVDFVAIGAMTRVPGPARMSGMAACETKNLLIVADSDLRSALAEQFAQTPEFALQEAATPQQALARIEGRVFDFLLVSGDLDAPGAGALLALARRAGFIGATILLSRLEDNPGQDFDLFLPLPLRFGRLLALVRDRFEPVPSSLALGKIRFSETAQTLTGPEGSRALTEKETAILARLARARGAVVARDVLLREVWGYKATVSTHTLETHIHRLRRKLEDASAQPRLLVTAQGGYRLTTGDDDIQVVQ